MDAEKKLELVLRAPCEEVVTREDLAKLLETKTKPTHYIGLEVSGLLHVGSMVLSGYKINDLLKAGFECTVFLADWHSVINNKLEGDWKKIAAASDYYEEAFKFFCPGAKIVRGSELYHNNDEYWRDMVMLSKKFTLTRAKRCLQIMGREESDSLETAAFFYPSMQAMDIKALGVDVAHAGTDQRKVHMLARDVFPKMNWKPPIALHHHLLPGLLPPSTSEPSKMDSKMSKSRPETAVFVHDSTAEIKKKLENAFCPPAAQGNPVLELAKYVAFHDSPSLAIERPQKFGGSVSFKSYEELEKAFLAKELHAADLKDGVAAALDKTIAPIRKHFEKKKALLKVYEGVEITR